MRSPTSPAVLRETAERITDMDTYDFPGLLKATRESLGLSMQRLAEGAACDVAMVSRLEHRQRNPTREMISRLCDGLGLDEDDSRAHDLFLSAGFCPPWYRVVKLEKIA